MTEPRIRPLGCEGRSIDRATADAIDTRPDATANRVHEDDDHTAHAVHTGIEAVDAAILTLEATEAVSGLGATGAGMSVASPFVALLGYGILIDHAFSEGDRIDHERCNAMVEGALAALEGRLDTHDAQRRMANDPFFAAGVRRLEQWAATHPDELAELADLARACVRGGELAIARGQEDTPEFRERYDSDPSFRHGADYMLRLRERDPEAFERKATRLEGLARDVESSRYCRVAG